MNPGRRIDYKALREVNPEAARLAVLEYLKTNGGNRADAARVFGINRSAVYCHRPDCLKAGWPN
jgi:hypothetical protein